MSVSNYQYLGTEDKTPKWVLYFQNKESPEEWDEGNGIDVDINILQEIDKDNATGRIQIFFINDGTNPAIESLRTLRKKHHIKLVDEKKIEPEKKLEIETLSYSPSFKSRESITALYYEI